MKKHIQTLQDCSILLEFNVLRRYAMKFAEKQLVAGNVQAAVDVLVGFKPDTEESVEDVCVDLDNPKLWQVCITAEDEEDTHT